MQRSESEPATSRRSHWTIQQLLVWATEDFRRRHFDSPRLDADLLLVEALGVDRIQLIVDRERLLSPEELSRFRGLVRRRRTGEPVAYILGQREFYGLVFRVDRRVLIPRPDTETLVDVALQRTRRRYLFGRAADLCTGCGCVAIAFARQRPTWQVTAVDIASDAVAVARDNALRLGAVPTVRLRVGNLLAPLPEHERLDLIVANPPYVPTSEYESLEAPIRDFEPRVALDGGPDGLAVTTQIIRDAPTRLAPAGVLALEVGSDQGDRVAAAMAQAGLAQIARHRDYAGRERVVSAQQPN
jgi:release factor glutamine methyltransferase